MNVPITFRIKQTCTLSGQTQTHTHTHTQPWPSHGLCRSTSRSQALYPAGPPIFQHISTHQSTHILSHKPRMSPTCVPDESHMCPLLMREADARGFTNIRAGWRAQACSTQTASSRMRHMCPLLHNTDHMCALLLNTDCEQSHETASSSLVQLVNYTV